MDDINVNLSPADFVLGDFFREGVSMNAQNGGCSNHVAVVSSHDFGDKAFLKAVGRFRI